MKKRMRCLALVFCIIVQMGLLALPASAADETAEHANALHELGLFSGTENGFQLERQPTRVEGLVMFIRLLGVEEEALFENYPHAFSDVPNWASAYVGYAYYHSLTTGVSQTTFGTDNKMTAGEYLTFLLRALGYDDSKGDFAWNTSIDKAAEIGFLTAEEANASRTQPATRGSMVDLSWAALTQPFKEDRSTTLAKDLVSKGVFTQQQAVQFDLWKEPLKPYLVKTLFRTTISIPTDSSDSTFFPTNIVLDGEDNLIYYDEGAKAILRRAIQDNIAGEPETLLDVKNATYTTESNGAYVTYRDLAIQQVFADAVNKRVLVTGGFQNIDQSANDGWSTSGNPTSYWGTFAVEHGKLVCLSQKNPYLLTVTEDGRYLAVDFSTYYSTTPSGKLYLWDPITNTKTEFQELVTNRMSTASIGKDLFTISGSGLGKYNFSTGQFDRLAITLPGNYWETRTVCQNGLFYFWSPSGVCVVRPNGQQKTLLNPQTDIEVTDITPMPHTLSAFFVTSDETFLFYDADAKAVRAVYPNPDLDQA